MFLPTGRKANFDYADLHSVAVYNSGNASNFFRKHDALKRAHHCHNLQQAYHLSGGRSRQAPHWGIGASAWES
jgi:hypothetical protein